MKFDSLRATWRYWVTGILVALIGVIAARVVAPTVTGKTHAVLVSAGRLTSFAGLIIIALGINRRAKTTSTAAHDNPPETPKERL